MFIIWSYAENGTYSRWFCFIISIVSVIDGMAMRNVLEKLVEYGERTRKKF